MKRLAHHQLSTALLVVVCALACGSSDEAAQAPAGPPVAEAADAEGTTELVEEVEGGLDALLARARTELIADLSTLVEHRVVRVLVSYSKTSFFYEGGRPRGFEVDMLLAWEKTLNEGKGSSTSVRLVFVPTPFHRLIDDLVAGRGDIIAAGLTVTPERSERAAFTRPYISPVSEVVVEHGGGGAIGSVDDLAGQRVVVRKGSSYVAHLEELSARLESSGSEAIEIVEADPRLVTEDLLEMVSAGVLPLTVADQHIAEAWAEVLPDMEVHGDVVVQDGGEIAWGVRSSSTELLASLNAFIAKNKQGSLLGNMLLKRYYSNSKWIQNPLLEEERAKLEPQIRFYRQYGDEFEFDWLALAAQAYQESGLDQSKKSPAGALGVMQLLPTTAADKWVNVSDIHLLENNIHAGAKYLDFLRHRYFDDAAIAPADRVDFAWAAYNAGPARIRRLRAKTAERGLDPNRWFANVEKLAAEEIGRETVDYVANINKYYLAYRLQYQAALERAAVRGRSGDS